MVNFSFHPPIFPQRGTLSRKVCSTRWPGQFYRAGVTSRGEERSSLPAETTRHPMMAAGAEPGLPWLGIQSAGSSTVWVTNQKAGTNGRLLSPGWPLSPLPRGLGLTNVVASVATVRIFALAADTRC